MNKSDVTIIIPTMGSERNEYALNECLTSLKESGFPVENILVVGNGEICPMTTHLDVKFMWILEQGQCKAVNAGVATVNTPYIMVSNDDMVYPVGWFERLVSPVGTWIIDASKEINLSDLTTKPHGVVLCDDPASAHSLLGDNFVLSPQLIEPKDGAPTFKKAFFGGVGGDFNKQGFMEYAGGCAGEGVRPGFNLPFLVKKETWDLVGGYDVAYDPWGSNSDSDLEYKFKLAGVNMWQNTNCPVYHFSNTSPTFHPDNHSYWQKNWEYFISKWGFERASSPEIWTTEFKIDYEKLKYRPKWAKLPEVEAL